MELYFTYQTKNLINGKTYIGVHKTKNINDGYIGNGIYRQSCAIREAKRKNIPFINAVVEYGYANFDRKVLSFFDSYEEALEEEKAIVNKDWVKCRENYNVSTGGLGRTNVPMDKEHKKTLIAMHSREYVVVDTLNENTYFVKGLTNWCRENFPELVIIKEGKKDGHRLGSVLQGNTCLYKNRWWACKKEDWTGEPIIKQKVKELGGGIKKFPYKVVDEKGYVHEGSNRAKFCREYGLDTSCFNKVLKGVLKSHKGFELYK